MPTGSRYSHLQIPKVAARCQHEPTGSGYSICKFRKSPPGASTSPPERCVSICKFRKSPPTGRERDAFTSRINASLGASLGCSLSLRAMMRLYSNPRIHSTKQDFVWSNQLFIKCGASEVSRCTIFHRCVFHGTLARLQTHRSKTPLVSQTLVLPSLSRLRRGLHHACRRFLFVFWDMLIFGLLSKSTRVYALNHEGVCRRSMSVSSGAVAYTCNTHLTSHKLSQCLHSRARAWFGCTCLLCLGTLRDHAGGVSGFVVFCFYCALRQWRRGNIAQITTIPVLDRLYSGCNLCRAEVWGEASSSQENSVERRRRRCWNQRSQKTTLGCQIPSLTRPSGPTPKPPPVNPRTCTIESLRRIPQHIAIWSTVEVRRRSVT